MRLDRRWIEEHIPHSGRMCLLEEVIEWDAAHIRCRSGTHRALDHPLRSAGRLGTACGVEYAAQAMAAHGALSAGAPAGALTAGAPTASTAHTRPAAGFLAAVRDLRLQAARIDDLEGDLICTAVLLAGDKSTALYEFALESESQRLLSGRATVIFDANKGITA